MHESVIYPVGSVRIKPVVTDDYVVPNFCVGCRTLDRANPPNRIVADKVVVRQVLKRNVRRLESREMLAHVLGCGDGEVPAFQRYCPTNIRGRRISLKIWDASSSVS